MPSGPSSPRSSANPRPDLLPDANNALVATIPSESRGGRYDNAQLDSRLSWNHLRQGESHQRIRHGAKQLLRLTENFSGYNGPGPGGGYETPSDRALPSDSDLRAMARLSHGIVRDINEIVALRKEDPNPRGRGAAEGSQRQVTFKVDPQVHAAAAATAGRRPRRSSEFSCHKCHRIDTPEWRPGPDGPGTLCNVCGLIYAKRERKKEESTMPTLGSPKLT